MRKHISVFYCNLFTLFLEISSQYIRELVSCDDNAHDCFTYWINSHHSTDCWELQNKLHNEELGWNRGGDDDMNAINNQFPRNNDVINYIKGGQVAVKHHYQSWYHQCTISLWLQQWVSTPSSWIPSTGVESFSHQGSMDWILQTYFTCNSVCSHPDSSTRILEQCVNTSKTGTWTWLVNMMWIRSCASKSIVHMICAHASIHPLHRQNSLKPSSMLQLRCVHCTVKFNQLHRLLLLQSHLYHLQTP